MKLIDKDKVVAEIEKRKSKLQSRITELGTFESNTLGLFQDMDLYDDILSFIDTLEVKEVNLEKEVHSQMDLLCNLLSYMEELSNGDSEGIYPLPEKVIEDLQRFAEHFLELGLKAQIGNLKEI